MSMQITIDPAKMTRAQRRAATDFILNYPEGQLIGALTTEINVDTSQASSALDALKEKAETTQAAIAELSPETAFSKPTEGTEVKFNVAQNSTVGAVVPTPNVSGADLDKQGFPWDHRIHSSNKAKVADGTWRKRRGVDDATVASVEAELRAVMGAPQAPVYQPLQSGQGQIVQNAAPVPAPLAPPSKMPPIPASLQRPQVPEAPSTGPTVAPVVPPAPVTPSIDARSVYTALIGRASAAVSQRKLTQEQITACCSQYGVPSLPLLANRLDLVQSVAAAIDGMIGAA